MGNNLIDFAQLYVDCGFNPVPCNSMKAQLYFEDLKAAPFTSTPIDDVEKRFASAEKIALACGQISSGLYVIDFDAHEGEPIHEIWEDYTSSAMYTWLHSKGLIAPYKSPHGYHLWFICPELEVSSEKLAMWAPKKVMIETRGNGAYCMTYPSAGYRPLGEHTLESIGQCDLNMAKALINFARSFSNVQDEIQDRKEGAGSWPEKWDTSTPHGKYNEEFAHEAVELLQQAGWTFGQQNRRGVTPIWRPGKSTRENIGATWGKRRHMFYCFTSSTEHFDQFRAYNPFQIFTNLVHGGDWKAAQDALRERFGMPRFEIKKDEEEEVLSFPLEVLPEDLQYIIQEYKFALNFKPEFTACAMISVAASIVGNSYKLRFKEGWAAVPVFWFAIVGEPGTTKSHPVSAMLKPLKEIDKKNKVIYDQLMSEWEAEEKKGVKPRFKQTIVSDATLEAVHMIHDHNKKGLLMYRDELYGFFKDMNKYRGGGDRQFWLESFNNDSFIVNRVTKEPIALENINVNLIGTIQPDLIFKEIAETLEDGLSDRFLYTSIHKEYHTIPEDDVNPNAPKLWAEICSRIASISTYENENDQIFLNRSKAAWVAIKAFDEEIVRLQREDLTHKKLRGYAAKMKTYVHRFALILCILDHVCYGAELEAQMDHYLRAEKLCSYFMNTFKRMVIGNDSKQEIGMLIKAHSKMSKIEQCKMLLEKGFSSKEIVAAGFDKTQVSKGKKLLQPNATT